MEVLPLSKTGLTNTEAHAENVSKAWECHFFLPFLKQLIPRPPTSWKKANCRKLLMTLSVHLPFIEASLHDR